MSFKSINPATGEVVKEIPEDKSKTIENKIEKAHKTFREWRATIISERTSLLNKLADTLEKNLESLSKLITEEMGKPIRQAEAEVKKCAWVCRHYAEKAPDLLAEKPVETDASYSGVRYEPLGVILGVMPWNFPLWQFFRFAVPAIAAGNTIVLKHASNVPRCALAIEEIFRESGAPEGLVEVLMIPSKKVKDVIKHELIRGVSLTGSTEAGMKVAQEAGKHILPSVMELGGSDPFIVLEDAILRDAARIGIIARMQNNGQSCIAAKRFIVADVVAPKFTELMKEQINRLKVGDPLDPETDIGPLARKDLVETLHEQVKDSVKKGARVLVGGNKMKNLPGFYYAPTLMIDVAPGMPVFDEETFGPVLPITVGHSTEEMIELANQSEYGLGASIWTLDSDLAKQLIPELETGMVFVNAMVRSDPRLPFGGVKKSGYGRELGDHGIYEFVNIKTVWIG
ncbi:MAG: NAD-dependent succinate-semialdehyde dehydrogenase [Chlorobi bacterium]|nr:NAD-dependent succinate-semialdehyde dehydrogenase [Chlorobiota bacterium]